LYDCNVDSESVTSLLYFLRLNGSEIDPATVRPPSEASLRRAVFDVVAGGGLYRLYTGVRVFRLDQAYRISLVGRLDSDDFEDVLRAAAATWRTFLGSTVTLYCYLRQLNAVSGGHTVLWIYLCMFVCPCAADRLTGWWRGVAVTRCVRSTKLFCTGLG